MLVKRRLAVLDCPLKIELAPFLSLCFIFGYKVCCALLLFVKLRELVLGNASGKMCCWVDLFELTQLFPCAVNLFAVSSC